MRPFPLVLLLVCHLSASANHSLPSVPCPHFPPIDHFFSRSAISVDLSKMPTNSVKFGGCLEAQINSPPPHHLHFPENWELYTSPYCSSYSYPLTIASTVIATASSPASSLRVSQRTSVVGGEKVVKIWDGSWSC